MSLAATARRPAVSGVAALLVLAVALATLAWRAGGAAATPTRPAVAEPTTSSSTTTPTTATTTATNQPTSTTIQTTVKPKPVTTTAAPRRTTIPATTPPPPAAAAAAPAPPLVALRSATSPAERCAAARQWVAEHGLALPAGWGFRCPGPAIVGGASRFGMACWNCEGNGSNWIAIDVGRIGASEAWLRHVIAHEICHAIDYMGLGITTELGADLCAAVHGAPRPA